MTTPNLTPAAIGLGRFRHKTCKAPVTWASAKEGGGYAYCPKCTTSPPTDGPDGLEGIVSREPSR